MKKFLSMLLALLMVGSSAIMTAAEEAETTAVAENAIHAASAEFLQEVEILKGKDDGELALNDNIKRYEMALFVARISTGWLNDKTWDNGGVNDTGFTDLEGSGAINAMGAINYATQKGIINGYGNGEFGPEDGITYQDALTMVVRALGYKDLAWPWECIEKAIDLGIDKNVTDKAYTAVLNRGEVAQIIYNALNATKKDGSTLAFDVFNMKEETIIITASDRVALEAGAAVAPAAGVVAFKTYNVANGAFGTVTYYAAAEEFAFTGHDDDLAVGHIYKVLLNTDDEGNIATAADGTIVKNFEAAEKTVFVNADGKNEVVGGFKAVTLASKSVRKAAQTTVYEKTDSIDVINGQTVAIDWKTGDILVITTEAAGYDYIINGNFYKIEWHYNELMNQYFRYKTNANGVVIGYEWLNPTGKDENGKEYNALLKAIEDLKKAYEDGFEVASNFSLITKAPAATAYANLTVEKFADNDTYLQGIYEEFGLGIIAPTTDAAGTECKECKAIDAKATTKYATYTISKLVPGMTLGFEDELGIEMKAGTTREVVKTVNTCPTHGVWFSGLEAGAAEEYVIYNYVASTGEINIVKKVEKQYGILRAYSVKKEHSDFVAAQYVGEGHAEFGMVLIDNTLIDLGYNALKGAGINYVQTPVLDAYDIDGDKDTDEIIGWEVNDAYLDGLDALYNQYVEYVVVDNHVVAINLAERNTTADKYLVMQEYIGKKDGTFVVEAYSTAAETAGKLSRYLINSVNGYAIGSYNYKWADAASLFATGELYYVTNYTIDANGNPVVDIVNVGGYRDGEFVYEANKVSTKDLSVEFTIDGLKVVDGDFTKLQENNGTYIVIAQNEVEGRAPIYVHTGAIDSDWFISGKVLKNAAGVSIFVDIKVEDGVELVNGFCDDAYLHGMYQYQGGKTLEYAAGEDAVSTFFGVDASLILPTEKYRVVEVVDLYTGNKTTKVLRNLRAEDLVENAIYVTVGNNVEYVLDTTDYEFVDFMAALFYTNEDIDYIGRPTLAAANYLFGAFTADAEVTKTMITDLVVAHYDSLGVDGAVVNDRFTLVDKIAVYAVDANDDITKFDATNYADYYFVYIYCPATESAVVYAFDYVAPETPAPETPAPETPAPETPAPGAVAATFGLTQIEGEAGEIVLIATVDSEEKWDSLMIQNVACDADKLEFVGFFGDLTEEQIDEGENSPNNLKIYDSAFGVTGLDNEVGAASIAFTSPKKLRGNICLLKFNVKEGATGTAEISYEVILKNTADILDATVTVTTVTLG